MYDSRLTLGKFVLFAVMPNILPDFGEKLALKLKNHLLPLSTTENPDYKSVWCVRPPAHVAAREFGPARSCAYVPSWARIYARIYVWQPHAYLAVRVVPHVV